MVLFNTYDDLVQSGAQDPLARGRCRRWMRPSLLQIRAQLHQMLSLLLTQGGLSLGLKRCEIIFDLAHGQESVIPSAFQFAGDLAVVRIDRIILPAGVGDLKASLPQRQVELSPRGRLFFRLRFECLAGGFDTERLQNAENFRSHRFIATQASE